MRGRRTPALLAVFSIAAALSCTSTVDTPATCTGSPTITILPESLVLFPGNEATYVVRVSGCPGRAMRLSWSTSNPRVASISSDTDSSAVVRGVATGSATVTARVVGSDPAVAASVVTVVPSAGIPMAAFAIAGIVVDPSGHAVAGSRVILRPVLAYGPSPTDTLGSCIGFVSAGDTLVAEADGSFRQTIGTARFQIDACVWARALPPPGSSLGEGEVSGLTVHSRPGPDLDTARLTIVLPKAAP